MAATTALIQGHNHITDNGLNNIAKTLLQSNFPLNRVLNDIFYKLNDQTNNS